MERALALARQGAAHDEVPVGAVLVQRGQIIAESHNLVETHADPTAHAEMLVLREGGRQLSTSHLVGCDLYVTLEPCAMCAQAMAHARIQTLFFGAYDPKSGGVDHGAKVLDHATCHHKPQVVGGILERTCSLILQEFFQEKR